MKSPPAPTKQKMGTAQFVREFPSLYELAEELTVQNFLALSRTARQEKATPNDVLRAMRIATQQLSKGQE